MSYSVGTELVIGGSKVTVVTAKSIVAAAKLIVAAAKVKIFEGYSLLFPTVGTDRLPVSIVAFPPWEIMQTRHQLSFCHISAILPSLLSLCCHS